MRRLTRFGRIALWWRDRRRRRWCPQCEVWTRVDAATFEQHERIHRRFELLKRRRVPGAARPAVPLTRPCDDPTCPQCSPAGRAALLKLVDELAVEPPAATCCLRCGKCSTECLCAPIPSQVRAGMAWYPRQRAPR